MLVTSDTPDIGLEHSAAHFILRAAGNSYRSAVSGLLQFIVCLIPICIVSRYRLHEVWNR